MEKPFEYQIEGAKWLKSKHHALLADEMGLGKSRQVVMATDEINAKSILIICPSVARINWQREFNLWSILSRDFTICESHSDYPTNHTIVSYDYATNHTDRLTNLEWDLLIIDESHFIKAVDAKRTSAILGKSGIIRSAKRCWALSGTPAPNHAGELWPLLYTFGITTLHYSQFISQFCNSYIFRKKICVTGTKKRMIPVIKNLLSNIMLRRLKDDVMKELPPIHYTHFIVKPGRVEPLLQPSFAKYCVPELNLEQLRIDVEAQRDLIEKFLAGTGIESKNGLKVLDGIAESIATLRQYTGMQKVDPIVEIVKQELEAKTYDKLVIFAIHRGVIEGLRRGLVKYKPVTLYGGTDPKQRQRNIDKFQNNPRCKIFIGNIMSAGTAITLTNAHNVIFAEQDWVPGNNAQAAMRCHRIGQTKPVHVRFCALGNSFDNKIAQALKRKTEELTEIFN